jgi:hypothetical protein
MENIWEKLFFIFIGGVVDRVCTSFNLKKVYNFINIWSKKIMWWKYNAEKEIQKNIVKKQGLDVLKCKYCDSDKIIENYGFGKSNNIKVVDNEIVAGDYNDKCYYYCKGCQKSFAINFEDLIDIYKKKWK